MSEQDEYARIGAVLRAAREALGYTQLRLASELGVAESTYSRYEAGKQKITIPELKHAVALLGVPLAAVLAGGPDSPPLVPDLADRIIDRLTERLPAIVRAVMIDLDDNQPNSRGPGRSDTFKTASTNQPSAWAAA